MRARSVLLLLLLLGAVLAASTDAAAHPEAWLTAKGEFRRDGTFVVDLAVSREFVPDKFGATAPPAEVAGLPSAKDVVQEVRGTLAVFSVLFDGRAAPTDAVWVPDKEEYLRVRLTGRIPESARAVVFRNDTTFGQWAVSVRHEGEEGGDVAFLKGGEPMAPVALREGFAPKPAARPFGVREGAMFLALVAWTIVMFRFRRKSWFRTRIVLPTSIAIAAVGLYWVVTR